MTTLFSATFEDYDLVHADTGFHSVNVREGGTIEVSAASALVGSYGLALTPEGGSYYCYGTMYVPKITRFRCAFYINLNTFTMDDGSYFTIIRDNNYSRVFMIRLHRSGSNYNIQPVLYRDDGGQSNGTEYALTTTHLIEFDWEASSAPGADDGYLSMWIDGVSKSTGLTSKDNDTIYLSVLSLGANPYPPASSSGTMYFDHFRANDDGSEIGA